MVRKLTQIRSDITLDQLQIVQMQNDFLKVEISPKNGGRIVSIVYKPSAHAFLWRNRHLSLQEFPPGSPYDPNFFGGIDEIIPGDLPEEICGIHNPDHGELWTSPLDVQIDQDALVLKGRLPRWGLAYQKRITLRHDAPWIDLEYQIENLSGERRFFLWKLHAAVVITPGDQIMCPAQNAIPADLQWSRRQNADPFIWQPVHEGAAESKIPPADGTTEFLFLYHLTTGLIGIQSPTNNCEFTILFDKNVFPYVCYFASYGGFDGHYTAILEPATAMPLSVNESVRLRQCSYLDAGAQLNTHIAIYAGPIRQS